MDQDLQEVKVPGDILIASLVPDTLLVINMGHSASVALTSVSANTLSHWAAMIVVMVVQDDIEYRKSSWQKICPSVNVNDVELCQVSRDRSNRKPGLRLA